MKKNAALKMVNPILGILLLNQVLTGLLRDFIPDELFAVLHAGAGFVFALVALLHVILNWTWIKTTFFKKQTAIKT